MRHSVWALLASVFLTAVPGYKYQFPADHFNHSQFATEWWYYTGNIRDGSGHRYGFELTFFRQAIDLPQSALASTGATWRPDQIYLAHLALTDIDGRSFYHTERLNRAGPGLAGAGFGERKYWNGNWRVEWKDLQTGQQQLRAVCERFTLTLDLTPLKAPVIHGKTGVSEKGPGVGEASHYISYTRLSAKGKLNDSAVTGTAWMDHEFFTQGPNPTLAGWDWFAIQLENNEELMLYRLRTKSGGISPFSSGTYVDAKGGSHFVPGDQIALKATRYWRKYPVDWSIEIASLDLFLTERTELDDQELAAAGSPSPSYWEGAVTYEGSMRGRPTKGLGYLEMTGYASILRLGH